VDGTRIACPRCAKSSVAHVTADQIRCSQCGHQWAFASSEERSLVPEHLTDARAEQFLEKYLRIKTSIKSEGEHIWGDSVTKARTAISNALDDGEKKRLLDEHSESWLRMLNNLQRTLVIEGLLLLAKEYEVAACNDEDPWFSNAYDNVWSSIESGYRDWFVCAVSGFLRPPHKWRVPEWAWSASGHLGGVPGRKKDSFAIQHFLFGFEDIVRRKLLAGRKATIDKALRVLSLSGSPIRSEETPKTGQGKRLRWDEHDLTMAQIKTSDPDKYPSMKAKEVMAHLQISSSSVYDHPNLEPISTGTRAKLFTTKSVIAVKTSTPE
jgi:hypothetical protein